MTLSIICMSIYLLDFDPLLIKLQQTKCFQAFCLFFSLRKIGVKVKVLMYVCWTWFKPINCKSKKSINLNSSQCEAEQAWLWRYSNSIYQTTCSLLLYDGKMMTKRSLVYNIYNSYCQGLFLERAKMPPAIQPGAQNDFCRSLMTRVISALSFCHIWVFKGWLS